MEVNTRGIYKNRCDSLFPALEVLKKIQKSNIPVTISSDAHRPEELSNYFPETINTLKDLGFNKVVLYNERWVERPL